MQFTIQDSQFNARALCTYYILHCIYLSLILSTHFISISLALSLSLLRNISLSLCVFFFFSKAQRPSRFHLLIHYHDCILSSFVCCANSYVIFLSDFLYLLSLWQSCVFVIHTNAVHKNNNAKYFQ